jgi:ABC-type transport system involved in cytochrome c biogenesis ATPase subunit
MFAGRVPQLDALEESLLQTRAGRSKNFMITGERGIGKTSLLEYLTSVAQGHIEIAGEHVKFLVVELDLDATSTDLGLIRRVNLGLKRELAKTEPARSFLSTGWQFLQRLEAFGVSLRDG